MLMRSPYIFLSSNHSPNPELDQVAVAQTLAATRKTIQLQLQHSKLLFYASLIGFPCDPYDFASLLLKFKNNKTSKSVLTINQHNGGSQPILSRQLIDKPHPSLNAHYYNANSWFHKGGTLSSVFFLNTSVFFLSSPTATET